MKTILNGRGVTKIYHFTDRGNIPSIIANGGILSLRRLEEKSVEGVIYGGNNWSHDADRFKGVDEFVHLAFLNQHPMAYTAVSNGRINSICWLEITLQILDIDGVRFCNDVSNKAGVDILANAEAITSIDVEGIYDWLDFNEDGNMARKARAEKSEVLIPNLVPLENILNINNFI
ncbi:DarT ssDNA thymidine ADP-ribosyltransferase family protein [Maridesulfovibrio sp.]|uniref:DarT ssDNA thymidine ADP-ribosyltransferase family protein n=1 Tax=Maridesulfovibrio sp. TaxID=2795000 RepID=UPI0029C9E627|nr:DarT ssDNA thymidine ADP-ribosyltransferase family protein [Maridesulfovibrio sp.]